MCCITFVWRVVLSLHKQIMFNHMRPCQTMSTRTKVCTCAASKSYQDNYVLLLYAASPIGVCWKRALPGNQYNYDVQLHWDQYDMNQWNPAIFKQLIYIYIYIYMQKECARIAYDNIRVARVGGGPTIPIALLHDQSWGYSPSWHWPPAKCICDIGDAALVAYDTKCTSTTIVTQFSSSGTGYMRGFP